MSSAFEKHQKRRLISSYFSVVISIALVLFLLGLLGMLVLNAKTIGRFGFALMAVFSSNHFLLSIKLHMTF